MKRPRFLSGRIACVECRQSWGTTWNTQAPTLICHLCGGACLPEGPQLRHVAGDNEIDAEMFRLSVRAMARARS